MIEEPIARQRILEAIEPSVGFEDVSLGESLGRIAAEPLMARIDLPGFDNSAMDGYAVRWREAGAGAKLRVTGEQAAGLDARLSLQSGEAIRIFTGAPIPEGADAVVMQEDVRRSEDGKEIEILETVEPGEWIRRKGADVCVGQRILDQGVSLTPARIGLVASQGWATVKVRPKPRIGIVTTGDEVVEPGSVAPGALPQGQLFNSNAAMLESLARQAGGEVTCWHSPDEPAQLRETLAEALKASDFIAIAGGVSVGERDFVKDCLTELGVVSEFWKVRVKPGKPFLFGRFTEESKAYVFGLPGNPVSAFVTWHLFVAPAIVRWQSGGPVDARLALPGIHGLSKQRLENPGDRPHYLRMRWDEATGSLSPSGMQQSHAL
ncbi:MAG: molybdopterin molybdotransferase MoeA, partial [Verrucomicrobiae bacterium]|nr:molybdopterin molybdotransferase MoeA [Verrucomicrobiae bacterium]